jgi:hypothetical protein
MKTQSLIKTIVMSSVVALIVTSCKKETINSASNPATIAAIQGMRTSYSSAKTYNDSLNYWYNMDSIHYIGRMYYCDSLYHYCNTNMINNYNTMNSDGSMTNGGMMGGGTANGSMMGGNNTTMNCSINVSSAITMINLLHQHHIHHPSH